MDYIVYDNLKKLNIHIELACKFYLHDSTIVGNQNAKWIGPNRKDTLDDKLVKLEQKQFPLLHQSSTVSLLNELEIEPKSISQQLCLKAFLFIPKVSSRKDYNSNYLSCIKGYWISFSEFNYEEKSTLYAIPEKKQWLLEPSTFKKWIGFSEALANIDASVKSRKSPLVYKKVGHKIELFFVVWW